MHDGGEVNRYIVPALRKLKSENHSDKACNIHKEPTILKKSQQYYVPPPLRTLKKNQKTNLSISTPHSASSTVLYDENHTGCCKNQIKLEVHDFSRLTLKDKSIINEKLESHDIRRQNTFPLCENLSSLTLRKCSSEGNVEYLSQRRKLVNRKDGLSLVKSVTSDSFLSTVHLDKQTERMKLTSARIAAVDDTDRPTLNMARVKHLLEVTNLTPTCTTADVKLFFSKFAQRGFEVRWVNDNACIAVFSSASDAESALNELQSTDASSQSHFSFHLRPIESALPATQWKVAHCLAALLETPRERPPVNLSCFRRHLGHHLKIKLPVSPELAKREKEQLETARKAARQRARLQASENNSTV